MITMMNSGQKKQRGIAHLGWLLAVALVLGGCGGGAENKLTNDPDAGGSSGGSSTVSPYLGPTPATEDVQRFKLYFYDQFRADNRCGACHGEGGQSPQFVREDDVNAAYTQALSVVNKDNPGASRVVEKVGDGHNCWIDNGNAVCAGDLRRAIEQWANTSGGSATTIELRAPDDREITVTKQFPTTRPAEFATTVYPLFAKYNCNDCHQAGSSTSQQPYFASNDLDESYDASLPRMEIDDGTLNRPLAEALSRFVVRLRSDNHNCGRGDAGQTCAQEAAEMLDAIKALAAAMPVPDAIPANWVTTKAVILEADGILASGGGRVDTGAIAVWDFSEGDGILAGDSSGVGSPMNLTLFGNVEWVGGNGIQINAGGRAQASTASSKKLADQIRTTGEFSVEMWVAPANVTQEGPARIMTYSSGSSERNFTVGQTLYSYDFMTRTSANNGNGEPALTTSDEDEDLQATLQHVVMTYSPVAGRRVYVNGAYTDDADPSAAGNLNGWDDGFAFMLGSESSGAFQWQGIIRFAAIYNRVLQPEEILQNFDAGVGEKYYLMFKLEHCEDVDNCVDLTGINDGFDSYVVFETSVFDSYSYLFNQPFLYRIGSDGATQSSYSGIQLQGMRIGINGKEPTVGQAYAKLDTTLEASEYGDMGQVLSTIGTILPLEGGSNSDEFFLTFERIGSNSDVRVEGSVSPTAPTPTAAEPDIGLRNFAEINASMAKITGVPITNANVVTTYNTVKQQLPGTSSVETFVSAQQMAVAQLAIEYCSELVDSTALRSAFFPAFANFGVGVSAAFDTTTERDQIIDPLFVNIVGVGMQSQPDEAAMKQELDNLIVTLSNNNSSRGTVTATDTQKIVKATCAAALGSAAVLLQ